MQKKFIQICFAMLLLLGGAYAIGLGTESFEKLEGVYETNGDALGTDYTMEFHKDGTFEKSEEDRVIEKGTFTLVDKENKEYELLYENGDRYYILLHKGIFEYPMSRGAVYKIVLMQKVK